MSITQKSYCVDVILRRYAVHNESNENMASPVLCAITQFDLIGLDTITTSELVYHNETQECIRSNTHMHTHSLEKLIIYVFKALVKIQTQGISVRTKRLLSGQLRYRQYLCVL